MREGSLFTGAGGGLYGSRLLGWRTQFMVEREPYCQRVLHARQDDGWFDECPIFDDVFTFDGTPWRGKIDVLSAGFPCQPFSVAGKRDAGDDPRNGWPHTLRLIREIRPPFVWLENVPGLLAGSHGYFGRVLGDLAESGYDAVWCVLGARDVGAPHRRDRLWILAYFPDADRSLLRSQQVTERGRSGASEPTIHGEPWHVANAHGQRELQQGRVILEERRRVGHRRPAVSNPDRKRRQKLDMSRVACDAGQHPWSIDPATRDRKSLAHVGRVANGVANRGDRLRALGNGQCPQSMVAAFRILSKIAIEHM